MPILAACDVELERDEHRYLHNIDSYMKIWNVEGYDIYKGTDPEVYGGEYTHLVAFDRASCIYSCYFLERTNYSIPYVECAEVRQDRKYKGFARKVVLDYFLHVYGTVRMSVGVSDNGMDMWEKLIEAAPYHAVVEARLDGSAHLTKANRPVHYTTNREPTTPVYMISNLRIKL